MQAFIQGCQLTRYGVGTYYKQKDLQISETKHCR
jgi:hypothetical protein